MLVTTVYLYDQIVNLKIKVDTDKQHWGYEMYNHPIKLYKGIDNTIQIQIKNDNFEKWAKEFLERYNNE